MACKVVEDSFFDELFKKASGDDGFLVVVKSLLPYLEKNSPKVNIPALGRNLIRMGLQKKLSGLQVSKALDFIIDSLPNIPLEPDLTNPMHPTVLHFLQILHRTCFDISCERLLASLKDVLVKLLKKYDRIIAMKSREFVQWKFLTPHLLNTGVVLGKGAFASVYLGYDYELWRFVAIKVVDLDQLMRSQSIGPTGDHMFGLVDNEVKLMRGLDCRHIVKVHRFCKIGSLYCIVMEYCRGGTLTSYVNERNALSKEEALSFLRQCAIALQCLRKKELMHRDIKPDNILVAFEDGRAVLKLTDFAFGKVMRDGDLTSSFLGTPLFMSPEQLKRKPYGPKADLWSMGCVLYFMLVGDVPIDGDARIDKKGVPIGCRGQVTIPESVEADCRKLLMELLAEENKRLDYEEFFSHPLLEIGKYTETTLVEQLIQSQERVKALEMMLEESVQRAGALAGELAEEKSKKEAVEEVARRFMEQNLAKQVSEAVKEMEKAMECLRVEKSMEEREKLDVMQENVALKQSIREHEVRLEELQSLSAGSDLLYREMEVKLRDKDALIAHLQVNMQDLNNQQLTLKMIVQELSQRGSCN